MNKKWSGFEDMNGVMCVGDNVCDQEVELSRRNKDAGFGLTICSHSLGSLQHMTTHGGYSAKIYDVMGQEVRRLKSSLPGGAQGGGVP